MAGKTRKITGVQDILDIMDDLDEQGELSGMDDLEFESLWDESLMDKFAGESVLTNDKPPIVFVIGIVIASILLVIALVALVFTIDANMESDIERVDRLIQECLELGRYTRDECIRMFSRG